MMFEKFQKTLRAITSKHILRIWFSQSAKLLWGTLIYNAFVILVLQPILRRFFPPLSGWEHVRRVFTGSSRYTYTDIVPYLGPTVWILGNGFLFAFLNRSLHEAQETAQRQDSKRSKR